MNILYINSYVYCILIFKGNGRETEKDREKEFLFSHSSLVNLTQVTYSLLEDEIVITDNVHMSHRPSSDTKRKQLTPNVKHIPKNRKLQGCFFFYLKEKQISTEQLNNKNINRRKNNQYFFKKWVFVIQTNLFVRRVLLIGIFTHNWWDYTIQNFTVVQFENTSYINVYLISGNQSRS